MVPKCLSRLTQGLKKVAAETRARHTVECDSVLIQQSISGKIVSLTHIVCVEAGFFQIWLHIGIMEVRDFFAPKYHPKTSLIFTL